MSGTPITYSLASINMRHHNAALHTLLETNRSDNILFIQEPWFRRVAVACSDTHLQGIDVLGSVAHPAWLLLYPHYNDTSHAKVVTYVRKFQCLHPTRPTSLQVVVRNDIVAHPCLQLLEVRAHRLHFQVVNFYNNVTDPSALQALLHLQYPDLTPHIVLGDFNLHSRTWSPAGWAPSPNVVDVEERLVDHGFMLCNQPGVPTCRGLTTEHPSTIDLVWMDVMAALTLSLSDPLISWEDSLGSDHVLLRVHWHIEDTLLDHTIAHSIALNTKHLDWDTHAL